MDETSVEFSVLLTVNSTWTKLNYWNAYKTQTSGAPEHVGTRGFVLAMFRHIHFFPYSNEIRESRKGRGTGWPASISRCCPARVPYMAIGRSENPGGAHSTGWGIMCPPGWDRVNWSAKDWVGTCPPGPPACDRPALPSWDFLISLLGAD